MVPPVLSLSRSLVSLLSYLPLLVSLPAVRLHYLRVDSSVVSISPLGHKLLHHLIQLSSDPFAEVVFEANLSSMFQSQDSSS